MTTHTNNKWKEQAATVLDRWRQALDRLEVRAKLVEMEARDTVDDELATLRRKWQQAKTRLDGPADDAQSKWESVSADFDAALSAARGRVDDLLGADDDTTPYTRRDAQPVTHRQADQGMKSPYVTSQDVSATPPSEATPYTSGKPDAEGVTHSMDEEGYKSPYVTDERRTV